MPTNSYKCKCGNEWTYIGPYARRSCDQCSEECSPLLPRDIETPSVFETVDKDRNVRWRENFEERAKKRNLSGTKKMAKELAAKHGEDPSKFGLSEDDAKLI